MGQPGGPRVRIALEGLIACRRSRVIGGAVWRRVERSTASSRNHPRRMSCVHLRRPGVAG